MKNLFVCIAALSLVACVEGQTKGSNPDLVANPGSADSVFRAPQELPTTGNGGGPGGGSVSLGNSSSVIAELGSSERDDLCRKTEDALTNALGGKTFSDVICEINAISFAASFSAEQGLDFQEACTLLSDECIWENSQESLDCPFNDSCQATVGEFEACLNSILPEFTRLQDLTCANFDVNSASQFDENVLGGETPECEAFGRSCDANPEPEPAPSINNSPNPDENNNDFNNFGE